MASRSENKTRPTDVEPADFVAAVEPARRRTDAQALLATMREVTGEDPVMWGPTIVGFGRVRYRTPAGREGEMPRVAFAPRKAHLVFYGLHGSPGADALLARLGKHRSSKACVYVNRLVDVDADVLRELIARAYRHGGEGDPAC